VAPSRSQLSATGFKNPDGSVVTVVLNRTAQKISFFLWMNGQAAETVALPHSINTYVIR